LAEPSRWVDRGDVVTSFNVAQEVVVNGDDRLRPVIKLPLVGICRVRRQFGPAFRKRPSSPLASFAGRQGVTFILRGDGSVFQDARAPLLTQP
jgi:hypothetical protein